MPSPIGHALGGLIVHAFTVDPRESRRADRAAWLGAIAAAPDLDLLLNVVWGPGHHRGAFHSVGAAILAGLAVAGVRRARGKPGATAWGLAAGLAWLSHVVLDYLGGDSNPPLGIEGLWPFSQRYFRSPVPLFMDIGRTLEWATVCHDAVAGAWEILVLLPVLVAVARWRQRRRD